MIKISTIFCVYAVFMIWDPFVCRYYLYVDLSQRWVDDIVVIASNWWNLRSSVSRLQNLTRIEDIKNIMRYCEPDSYRTLNQDILKDHTSPFYEFADKIDPSYEI